MTKYLKIFVLLSSVVMLGVGCSQTPQPSVQVPVENIPVVETSTPSSTVAAPIVESKPEKKTLSTEVEKSTGKTVVVNISNFTFVPDQVVIKVGDTVTWTNDDDAPHKIASNPHPTHTDLPGLVSDVLNTGQSYSYTFEKAGTWGYHCHLHPSMLGTVVVE